MGEGSPTITETKISVVMPVTQLTLAGELLRAMAENTLRPVEVLIIDDSATGFSIPQIPNLNARMILRSAKGDHWPGVNYFWMFGIKAVRESSHYVSVLNDDIVIHKFFFEMIARTMNLDKGIGAACPNTTASLRKVHGHGEDRVVWAEMWRREGWAFTFRKSVLDQIPPIPPELKVFFGDDWLYYWTYRLGYNWVWMKENTIFHYVGKGVGENNLRTYLNRERACFEKMMRKLPVTKYPVPYYWGLSR